VSWSGGPDEEDTVQGLFVEKDAAAVSNRMEQVMNTAVIRSDWVGRTVEGKFPLLECLGDSGTSAVFRTELREPPAKKAAIRLIPVDGENPQSLMSEWAAAASLSHPHLMKIFLSGHAEIDGIPLLYVVTEYAEENLAQIIPVRPLSPEEVREMLPSVFDALSYLHGRGMAFGHLKPSNIMVVDNLLKLPLDSIGGRGRAKTQMGPWIYDAPEIVNGAGSPVSDVWSVGVTVVEALTQHPPFWDRSKGQDPLVPTLPQPFADIARQCLRVDPGNRATLGSIRSWLEGSGDSQVPASERETGPIPAARLKVVSVPASAPGPTATPEPMPAARVLIEEPRRSVGSNRSLLGLAGAAVVVLAVIAFVIARGHRSQPPTPPVAETPSASASAPQAAAPQPPVAQPPASGGSAVAGDVTERVMPDVSTSALRTIHGKVLVKIQVTVDANGVVSGASIRSSASRYFGAKALEAARRWRFRPPQANSQAVPSAWTLEFIFRQNGTTVKPVQVTR
jgi:serine/threonine-protein kinase